MYNKQQIEKIAILGCTRTPKGESCSDCPFAKPDLCNAYGMAIKISENSVVLTREEYKLLFDIKKKFETADGEEITAVSLLMWLKELNAQERKETAEQIYKDIRLFLDDKTLAIITRYFKEILGVEIKE